MVDVNLPHRYTFREDAQGFGLKDVIWRCDLNPAQVSIDRLELNEFEMLIIIIRNTSLSSFIYRISYVSCFELSLQCKYMCL